jgi:hypothetical protein
VYGVCDGITGGGDTFVGNTGRAGCGTLDENRGGGALAGNKGVGVRPENKGGGVRAENEDGGGAFAEMTGGVRSEFCICPCKLAKT